MAKAVAVTLAAVTAALSVQPVMSRVSDSPSQTSFVIFFVDDMGYGDLQSFGAPTTSTPHIDALAAQGMRFTQWYSAHPICTPSRAAMVTGRLPIRNGLCGGAGGAQGVFPCDAQLGLPKNETTFAAALKPAGYRSMAIGKWHLGQKWEFMPHQHGFDSYYGVPYSVDMGLAWNNRSAETSFEDDYYGCTPLPLVANETVLEQPTDLAKLNERYVEAASVFLRQAAADRVPFLLYVAFGHVHTPQYAGRKYEGVSRRGVFGDSVAELDAAVGSIMATLRDLPGGISNDTLVVLTSDNGAPNAAQHAAPWLPLQPISGSNGPFLGEKTTTWEGGLRVPGIVVWPNVVQPNQVSEEIVSTLDVFATLMDAADVPLPSDRIMDSHSLRPILNGSVENGSQNWTRESAFFYRGCDLFAVRHKQWKLHVNATPPATQPPAWNYTSIAAGTDSPILFDIEADPSERFPLLSDSHATAGVISEINQLIEEHRRQLGVPPEPILGKTGGAMVCCDQTRNCTCTPKPPPEVQRSEL